MNDEELLRYSRQIMLPDVDVAGQEKILAASVVIMGMGGLGAPVAVYLAAAGVGKLTLVDDDVVDFSNLQRQIVHLENAIGNRKVESAALTLGRLNSHTNIQTIDKRMQEDAMQDCFEAHDVVVDATDNFSSRYMINRTCVMTKTPLVSGAAIRMEGQIAVFDSRVHDSPCYQCLYSDGTDEQLNCAENGVIAPLVGIIGTIQAMETLKLIAQFGETLTGYVLYIDSKNMDLRKLKLPRNPRCPTCA